MSEKVKIALIVSVGIIIASSLGTLLNIQYKNSLEQDREGDRNVAKNRYERCLSSATSNYNVAWANHCEEFGLDSNCMLPTNAAKEYEKSLVNSKEQCLTLYQAELR